MYDMDDNELIEAAARLTPQWVAGFFDGEGCVTCYKNPNVYTVRVVLTQADPKILALIALKFGSGGLRLQTSALKGGTKQIYRLSWIGKACIPFLRCIKDHTICKKRQVNAGLELAELHVDGGRKYRGYPNESAREKLAMVIRGSNHGVDTTIVSDSVEGEVIP